MTVARIIGIDGEGQDTPDGRHIYTYLCASDEEGAKVADAWNGDGLSLDECVCFFLRLPEKPLKVSFMFSYDTTMILAGLPPLVRYYVVRPDLRQAKRCHKCRKDRISKYENECPRCGSAELVGTTIPVRYDGVDYDWFNGSFSLSAGRDALARLGLPTAGMKKRARSIKVWDVFRFFQSSFVTSLERWSDVEEDDGPPLYLPSTCACDLCAKGAKLVRSERRALVLS